MRTIGVTGAGGFLGWHVRARLVATGEASSVGAGRSTLVEPSSACAWLRQCDAVVHAAGVNRASDEGLVRSGNVDAAQQLADALIKDGRPLNVAYANSIKIDAHGAFAESKAEAAAILRGACESTGGRFVDVVLPHLFGEYGKPHYNSAVHTFSHLVANGESPELHVDAELSLLHAQDASKALVAGVLEDEVAPVQRLEGETISVSEVMERLKVLAEPYLARGSIPKVDDLLDLRLFNTIRANLYPEGYPLKFAVHGDERGGFYEVLRSFGQGQTSISTTVPGVTRGEHFHLTKIERFVVVAGEATISMRRLLTDEVTTYRVSGTEPVAIDMPPLTTHNIVNVGSNELVTVFWSNDHFDPDNPDTYGEPVMIPGATGTVR